MSEKKNKPKDLGKVYKFMERFWLIIAVASTIASTYIVITDGFDKSKIYIALPVIAFAYWFMRRRIRKSYERKLNVEKQEQAS
jgi:FtsH-binding integral membrane protein